MAKVITAAEAAALIQDGWSIAVGGFVGSGHPEALRSEEHTSELQSLGLNTYSLL